MGGNVSAPITKVINDAIVDQSYRYSNQTTSDVSDTLSNTQKAKIDVRAGGDLIGCIFGIDQSLKMVKSLGHTIDKQTETNFQRELNNVFNNDVKREIKQKIKDLPLGVNEHKAGTFVDNYSFTDMSTDVARKVSSNLSSDAYNFQDGELRVFAEGNIICGPDNNKTYIAQNMDVQAAVQNAIKDVDVANYVAKAINDFTNTDHTKLEQVNEGFSIWGMIGAIIAFIIIVVFAVIFFRFILPMIMKKRKAAKAARAAKAVSDASFGFMSLFGRRSRVRRR